MQTTTTPAPRSLARHLVTAAVALSLAAAALPAAVDADAAEAHSRPGAQAYSITADPPSAEARVNIRWERLRVP